MMIAFITINSGLVPLIKGLCAQILYFTVEIIGGLRSHLLLFFPERKNKLKKKQLVQDLIPAPPSIYIHMCTLYTYMNIYMPRFSPSEFFRPSMCLIPTPVLTTEYPICAVCVCVCVHTHTSPYTPTCVKIREETDNTPLRVLKDVRRFIRRLSSVVKSKALKKSCYPQVPGSIPAENTSTQIHMDLSKQTLQQGF